MARRFSVERKLAILAYADKHGVVAVASKYQVDRATVARDQAVIRKVGKEENETIAKTLHQRQEVRDNGVRRQARHFSRRSQI